MIYDALNARLVKLEPNLGTLDKALRGIKNTWHDFWDAAFDVGRTAQAISYEKGCYLGQEPIVMARDRAGHAPRTLLGLKLAGTQPATRGDKVAHHGEDVGFVTSSVNSPRLGTIALAYLRHGHQTTGTAVEVRTSSGPLAAVVSALPLA